MRTPILIISLFALIAAGSYGIQYALETSSQKLSMELTNAQKEIASGNKATARRSVRKIDKEWRKIEGTWALITDHREMDEIDMTLVRLDSLLQVGQIFLALSELSTMQRLVKHIPEKERFNLKNVL